MSDQQDAGKIIIHKIKNQIINSTQFERAVYVEALTHICKSGICKEHGNIVYKLQDILNEFFIDAVIDYGNMYRNSLLLNIKKFLIDIVPLINRLDSGNYVLEYVVYYIASKNPPSISKYKKPSGPIKMCSGNRNIYSRCRDEYDREDNYKSLFSGTVYWKNYWKTGRGGVGNGQRL